MNRRRNYSLASAGVALLGATLLLLAGGPLQVVGVFLIVMAVAILLMGD